MSLWASNKSIGVCWSKSGQCFAVKLSRHGDGLRVDDVWRTDEEESPTLSSAVPEVLRTFEVDDSTRVIVGGPDQACAIHDLRMPRLGGQDLRNALLVALRKQCPLPVDQLAWGYRVIPGTAKENSQTVRLFYARDEEWDRWVENISGLNRRVDALMSPRICLDPVFSEFGIVLDNGVILGPLEDGVRVTISTAEDDHLILGDGDRPLVLPRLSAGPLTDLTPDEQREFIPALILAAHGAVGDPGKDRRTMPAYPSELVPKRNRLTSALAALLAAYVVVVGLVWAGLTLKESMAYNDQLRTRTAKVQERVAELEEARGSGDVETALVEGLDEMEPDMPRMGDVLAEITDILPAEFWIVKMSWTSGKVELDVRGDGTDLGFIQALEDSSVLKEVELTDKKMTGGKLVSARIRLLSEGPDAAKPAQP